MRCFRLKCEVPRVSPHARGQSMRYRFPDSINSSDPPSRRREFTSASEGARRLHKVARVSRLAVFEYALTIWARGRRQLHGPARMPGTPSRYISSFQPVNCSTTTPLLNETSFRFHLPAVFSVWRWSADRYIDGGEAIKEGHTRRPKTVRL